MFKQIEFKLYPAHDDTHIRISEDADELGMVDVTCKSDYFGKMDFRIDADEAIVLANTILEMAKIIKEK